MKKLTLLPFLLLAGCTMYPDAPPDRRGASEARLAEQLAGRVPDGPPQACVRQRDIRGNRPVDARTILFEGPGDTIYVNRTRSSCAGMREWHAIRLRTIGTSMCYGELIVAFDPNSGIEQGACTLGEFQPYRRPR